jgi:hypothetical protein
MMLSITNVHPSFAAMAFLQGTQLSLFEQFLTQAVSGINSTSITAGMQNVAYVVLLVGFLWQVYQSAMHGGDVRGLGTNLIKYVVTAVVIMNYSTIFTTVNQGFVNSGNWIGNASGFGSVLDNWKTDVQNQFNQVGYQKLWGIVTGDIPGLLDALLVIVGYILYPIVVVIFGFFYIFYGSVLYIFGPIVISLMPLGATNRIAKAYVENLFIWNSWPILYGGFGALLGAVQMGQVSQMLAQNSMLGALGNLEGSILIGIVSIVYSLAIAVIPFIANRIVSGDVGSTAAAMVGAAVTALTMGAAAYEGAAAGFTGAGSGATSGTQSSGSAKGTASAGSGRTATATASGNQPTPGQQSPRPGTSSANRFYGVEPTAEGHAEQIRAVLGEAMGSESDEQSSVEAARSYLGVPASAGGPVAGGGVKPGSNAKSKGTAKGGPNVHRYNIGTWGTYHAARLAARGLTGAVRGKSDQE